MLLERMVGIAEEIGEVQSLAELKCLHCFGQQNHNEYADATFVSDFKAAVARLKSNPPVDQGVVPEPDASADLRQKLAALEAEVARLRVEKVEKPVARASGPCVIAAPVTELVS